MLGIFFMGKGFLGGGENQVQDNKNNKRSRLKNLLLVLHLFRFLLGDISNNGCANSVFAAALYGIGEGK